MPFAQRSNGRGPENRGKAGAGALLNFCPIVQNKTSDAGLFEVVTPDC